MNSNVITKELAKMLKQSLKSNWPYATWKVTTHRGLTIDMIDVQFDGEVDIKELRDLTSLWSKDDLAIYVSGNSYKMI
jgi:hypothetical protein